MSGKRSSDSPPWEQVPSYLPTAPPPPPMNHGIPKRSDAKLISTAFARNVFRPCRPRTGANPPCRRAGKAGGSAESRSSKKQRKPGRGRKSHGHRGGHALPYLLLSSRSLRSFSHFPFLSLSLPLPASFSLFIFSSRFTFYSPSFFSFFRLTSRRLLSPGSLAPPIPRLHRPTAATN